MGEFGVVGFSLEFKRVTVVKNGRFAAVWVCGRWVCVKFQAGGKMEQARERALAVEKTRLGIRLITPPG